MQQQNSGGSWTRPVYYLQSFLLRAPLLCPLLIPPCFKYHSFLAHPSRVSQRQSDNFLCLAATKGNKYTQRKKHPFHDLLLFYLNESEKDSYLQMFSREDLETVSDTLSLCEINSQEHPNFNLHFFVLYFSVCASI